MQIVLNLVLPFFAVIALGILAVRTKLLGDSAVQPINIFVFYFTMPALLAGTLAKQDFAALINVSFMSAWLVAALVIYLLGMAVSRVFFKANLKEMALSGQASAIGNVGFLGFPLMFASFGDEGLLIASTAIFIDLIIFMPITLCILEAAGGGTLSQSWKRILKGAFVNPFIIAILLGTLLSAGGWNLDGPIERFLSFLGGAAAPAALFAIGVSLGGRKVEGDVAAISTLTFLKLFAHPLAALIVFWLFGVEGEILAIGLVLAAIPIAGNVFVIAQQYDSMVRRCSSAILVSTALAIVTIAIVLNWAGVTSV